MRLTIMSDYALRLLLYLGRHPDRLCTTAEIAQAYDISETHLTKVTHQLGRSGWVSTVRGKGGGMRLALEPQYISLGAVLRSVEPDFQLVECLGADSRCNIAGACRLTAVFNEAMEAFLAPLDRRSLADVLGPLPGEVQLLRRMAGGPARPRRV